MKNSAKLSKRGLYATIGGSVLLGMLIMFLGDDEAIGKVQQAVPRVWRIWTVLGVGMGTAAAASYVRARVNLMNQKMEDLKRENGYLKEKLKKTHVK